MEEEGKGKAVSIFFLIPSQVDTMEDRIKAIELLNTLNDALQGKIKLQLVKI